MLILGYDPGRPRANAAALLHIAEASAHEAWLHTDDSVGQVLEWAQDRMAERGLSILDAAGIDTYLSWSTERRGWRPMDTFLRDQYPAVRRSVFPSNSARGAMAVQGMAMALRLRRLWPEILLNETHPKVLYHALSGQNYVFGDHMRRWLLNRFEPPVGVTIHNEHEWDALFSAWITWQGMKRVFETDLMTQGDDRLLLPAGNVSYYWI